MKLANGLVAMEMEKAVKRCASWGGGRPVAALAPFVPPMAEERSGGSWTLRAVCMARAGPSRMGERLACGSAVARRWLKGARPGG